MSRGKTNLRKKPGYRLRRNRRRTTNVIAPGVVTMSDGTERLLTRRVAERMIAETEDVALLVDLQGHANKHVKKNAIFKMERLRAEPQMEESES